MVLYCLGNVLQKPVSPEHQHLWRVAPNLYFRLLLELKGSSRGSVDHTIRVSDYCANSLHEEMKKTCEYEGCIVVIAGLFFVEDLRSFLCRRIISLIEKMRRRGL